MSLKLGTVEEEKARCIKAFEKANTQIGDFVIHCHHDTLLEILHYSHMDRIEYIIKNKTDNPALRLRLFRPYKPKALNKAYKALNKAYKAHNKACYDYHKACDDYNVTYDVYNKAYNDYNKAFHDYYKVSHDYKKACNNYYNSHKPKNDPWNGKTIFAGEYAL